MSLNYNLKLAISMASRASIETRESVYENLEYYREKNFTYIPMPLDGEYMNTESEETFNISDDQYIQGDASAFVAVSKLRDEPFLLIDSSRPLYIENDEITESYDVNADGVEVVKVRDVVSGEYGQYKSEMLEKVEEGTYIITLADMNKRDVKDVFYPTIAEFENQLSQNLKKEYPAERQDRLISEVKAETVGRWEKSKHEGLDLHIAEFMTLSDLLKVFGKNEYLRSIFGFDSRNQFDKRTSGIVDLRNQIMHSTRTLVHDREGLHKLVNRIQRIHDLLEEVGVSVKRTNYDRPEIP